MPFELSDFLLADRKVVLDGSDEFGNRVDGEPEVLVHVVVRVRDQVNVA